MGCPGTGPTEYRAKDIRILTGLEPIRLRPGMYLGWTDSRGLHHMLFAMVRESLAESASGNGRAVRVTLHADGSAEVGDDREPPVQIEPLFAFFGTGGHNELTYVFANALSEWLRVESVSGADVYHQRFRRGVAEPPVQLVGTARRGLTVRFRPDPDIFGTASFDADTVRDRLRQYAFLHSGVRITFTDEAAGTRDEFEYADGIREYVRRLNAGRAPLHPDVIVIRGEADGVRYEVGLQWCKEVEERTESFANDWRTVNGGTHVNGLRAAVRRAVSDVLRGHPAKHGVNGEDVRDGLTAVVSVRMPDAWFSGATRDRLGSPQVEGIVAAVVRQALDAYFDANPAVAAMIASRALTARELREAVRAARSMVRATRKWK